MKIIARAISAHYLEIYLESDNVKLHLGLFDNEQRKEFVQKLREEADYIEGIHLVTSPRK